MTNSNFSLSVKAHSQNGKPTCYINVLDQSFTYSDKRGHSMHTTIDYDFAIKIINTFPAKMGRGNFQEPAKEIKFLDRLSPNPNHKVILKWNYFGKGLYELMIHSIGHVWTSEPLEYHSTAATVKA